MSQSVAGAESGICNKLELPLKITHQTESMEPRLARMMKENGQNGFYVPAEQMSFSDEQEEAIDPSALGRCAERQLAS